MIDIKELLGKLNDEQIKPVLDTEGAVLVIAGAGSGKTRVLTSRIAYLVLEKHIEPSSILAITFTNKAAEEMKERLESYIDNIGGMWVSTIHSMCVKILRNDIGMLGFDKNFTIYDETDKDKVLKLVLDTLGLDADKLLKKIKIDISNAKNECLSPEDYKKVYCDSYMIDQVSRAYEMYNDILERNNALDFDDLLYRTYLLFKDYPQIADKYARKFKYIHIDEFQDTNKVQFLIAQRLSIANGNIFVVGDDDQSIYGWRGARVENILYFDDIYRGAKIYKLQKNYRSTKRILSLANGIIKNNTERREKELYTDNEEGNRIEQFIGGDENSEATYTAIEIKNLIDRNQDLSYKDFAVFMRVNALSRAYEQEFTKYGIPYKIFGGFRFFERKEIKDVLSYLKLVNNPKDNQSFLRCVSTPKRGIGEKTLTELMEFSTGAEISMLDGIDRLEQTTISSGAKTKLFNFGLLINSFTEYSKTHTVSQLLDYVISTTAFMEQFSEKSEENTSKIYNISELKNSVEQFEKDNYGASLSDYLNAVTLSSDTDDINIENAVTIATIHASKGLEYKCVFVAGLDEKIIPVARASESNEELEEERRLMYVAVTRAKERLYLTRAMSRYLYGNREYMTPSRFLKEAQMIISPEKVMPKNEYSGQQLYKSTYNKYSEQSNGKYNADFGANEDFGTSKNNIGGYSSVYAKSMLKDDKPKIQQNVASGVYKTGTKVKHAKFGVGTVIEVKGSGDNLIATVAFQGVGIKALAIKYAPMEIINE